MAKKKPKDNAAQPSLFARVVQGRDVKVKGYTVKPHTRNRPKKRGKR